MSVKWLLAGAGDIVRSRVAAALSQARNSEIAAVFAPSVGKAESIAAQYHIPAVYHDFSQALAESGADCVYIATPHHTHVELAKQSLAAGKHFFSEKPLGINLAECREVAVAALAAEKKGLKAACSNYRLFTNQYKITEKLIREGVIGDLFSGWLHDEEPYFNPGNHPCLKAVGASPEHSFGFYLFNIIQHLFGMPETVLSAASCINAEKHPEYDLDDIQNIIMRFSGGRQVSVLLNFTAPAAIRHSYSFAGTKGRIYWPGCPPHFNMPIQLVTKEIRELPESVTGERGSHPNWHLPMIQDFVDAVSDDRTPYCTVRSAAETSLITDAVIRSIASGKFETVGSLF